MKPLHHITCCLLLLTLAACHSPQREARRMVARAERLFDTLPDSTASLIDSVLRMPVYFNEKRRMDMALLQAEALMGDRGLEIPPLMDDDFFDDKPFFSTSPELERAAEYYAKKKKYAKAAHAALYSGFVQQHYNDKAAAMLSFKEAERYGEMAGDSLTVARAEYRIGKMLYYDYMEEEAVFVLKAADKGFGTHYAERAFVQNMIAAAYIVLNRCDSAEIFLNQGLIYAEKSHSVKARQKVLNNYSVFYQQQGLYNQAIACLKQLFDGNHYNSKLPLYYLNIGNIYAASNQIDSASYYYDQLEEILSIVQVKDETLVAAFAALSRFSENQGEIYLALQYRNQRDKALNRLRDEIEQKHIYAIQRKYDYESLKNSMNQKLSLTQRIIAIVSVLLLGIVVLFFYRLAQRNRREAEINANLFHFMQQNKELVESNMAHEKKILDTRQQLSDLLNARLKAMQKLDYCLKTPKDKIALKDLEREVFGCGDHWEAIKEVLVALYPGLWETLKLKYPEMDEMDFRICMLSHLKLSRLGEATLLGISISVLDKRRTKIRKMMEQS